MPANAKRVLLVGGGFAGLNAAQRLGSRKQVEVTLIDRNNHHLFQPLLYQVAMAGLSPADIAVPIRSLVAKHKNIRVLQGEAQRIDAAAGTAVCDFGEIEFDYLLLCCGARHSYFGHDEWEEHAPGLKTIEQATEIRRRVLTAFEIAERADDKAVRRKHMTFVIVGGGATGVELAGAIGEMSRYTLAKDFRSIDSKLTRIILIEAGPRILTQFDADLAAAATRDLERLGVQVWTNSLVTRVDEEGVEAGSERINAATVLWAAGVRASGIGEASGFSCDRAGRIIVEPDLSVPGHQNVFVAGDLAHFEHGEQPPLPGVAPVATQQGRFFAKTILAEIAGKPRSEFQYRDKGQLAMIGRSTAIAQTKRMKLRGWLAWWAWLLVHIYFLTGFRNRLFVVMNWAWSFVRFRRGARLIVNKEWRFGKEESPPPAGAAEPEEKTI